MTAWLAACFGCRRRRANGSAPASTGRLIYVPDAEGDRILDFSDVGYQGRGTELIPDNIPNVVTVSPVAGDDTANIQAAINLLAALPPGPNGFRGAVLLTGRALRYQHAAQHQRQRRRASRRRSRHRATVLHGRGTTQRPLDQRARLGSQSFTGNPKRNMIDKVVPAGATSFRVDSIIRSGRRRHGARRAAEHRELDRQPSAWTIHPMAIRLGNPIR